MVGQSKNVSKYMLSIFTIFVRGPLSFTQNYESPLLAIAYLIYFSDVPMCFKGLFIRPTIRLGYVGLLLLRLG